MNAHHHFGHIFCRFKKVTCFNVDALTGRIIGVHHMARRCHDICTRQSRLDTEQVQTPFAQSRRVQIDLHGTARTADGLYLARALDLLQVHFETARHTF